MIFETLDNIVRNLLLKEGKPMHYYIQYLAEAASGFKFLNITTLKNINAKKIPVNAYKAVTLPCDYADFVRIGFAVGERIRPMIQDKTLNRLNDFDSSGNKIPYPMELPDGTTYDDVATLDYMSPLYVPSIISNSNVQIAFFNRPVDRDDYMFKVLPERNEIQLSADYPYDYVWIEYISDGQDSDSATKVDTLATDALEKYIMWQYKVHSRSASEGERQAAEQRFWQAVTFLRRSKSDLITKEDFIHAYYSGYSGTYK